MVKKNNKTNGAVDTRGLLATAKKSSLSLSLSLSTSKLAFLAPVVLAAIIATAGAIFMPSIAKADNTDVVDRINITVPISCTMSGTGMNTHNATINNGQYNSNIGETTLKAFCNDNEGFAIYAIGYTDNLNGKNVLTNSTLGSSYDIATGTATSGNTSNWAMKVTTVSDPAPTYPIIIQNSFDSFHAVPDEYTLVAKRTAGTDIGQSAEGSTLKTTYQAYISKTQAAGTYTGQVKYTLVHPHNNAKPLETMLDNGQVVAAKMKTLAAGEEKTYNARTSDIKAIHMANTLPADFEATEANTVSVSGSKYPIYIFFDNTNDAGIMYFYTEGDSIGLNPDANSLFYNNSKLSDITGVADWDASQVSDLSATFANTKLTTLSSLANWDMPNLSNLGGTFGFNTSLTDASAISIWDTKEGEIRNDDSND